MNIYETMSMDKGLPVRQRASLLPEEVRHRNAGTATSMV